MHAWMSAQGDLISKLMPKKGKDSENLDSPLHVCGIMRPISEKRPQVVLVKQDQSGIISFFPALIFAVYRGSISRSQGGPRKLKVTKCLGINAPVEAVSRAHILRLTQMPGGHGEEYDFFSTLLSDVMLVTPSQDIVCEVPLLKSGQQGGKFFCSISSATMDALQKIHSGEVNPLTVFLPRTSKDSKTAEVPDDAATSVDTVGFSCTDFGKGQAGQKNLKLFFTRLPEAFKKAGVNLLNGEGHVKIGKTYYSWQKFVPRMALFFDLVESGEKKGHGHSKGVYFRLSQFLSCNGVGMWWNMLKSYLYRVKES